MQALVSLGFFRIQEGRTESVADNLEFKLQGLACLVKKPHFRNLKQRWLWGDQAPEREDILGKSVAAFWILAEDGRNNK